jgi:tetratricopeptide (TPR) repeat protein
MLWCHYEPGVITECTPIIEDPSTDPSTLSDAYGLRGLAYSRMKRSTEAMADYSRAIKINPDSAVALNNRAWELFRSKGNTEGLADVERSLQIDPESDIAWDTRAHINQLLGNHERAFLDYEFSVILGVGRVVRVYQCGLSQRGLFHGKIDGIYDDETRVALKTCAFSKTCDPLPDNVDAALDGISCNDLTS